VNKNHSCSSSGSCFN